MNFGELYCQPDGLRRAHVRFTSLQVCHLGDGTVVLTCSPLDQPPAIFELGAAQRDHLVRLLLGEDRSKHPAGQPLIDVAAPQALAAEAVGNAA